MCGTSTGKDRFQKGFLDLIGDGRRGGEMFNLVFVSSVLK